MAAPSFDEEAGRAAGGSACRDRKSHETCNRADSQGWEQCPPQSRPSCHSSVHWPPAPAPIYVSAFGAVVLVPAMPLPSSTSMCPAVPSAPRTPPHPGPHVPTIWCMAVFPAVNSTLQTGRPHCPLHPLLSWCLAESALTLFICSFLRDFIV